VDNKNECAGLKQIVNNEYGNMCIGEETWNIGLNFLSDRLNFELN